MKDFKLKKVLIVILFWWAIMFPMFNFLPQNVDENADIEIRFFIYDLITGRDLNLCN